MSSARDYLIRSLDVDLVEEPAKWFELRRAYREPAAESSAPTQDRELLEAELARIAGEFYDLSDDELDARLDMDLAAFPDLERYRARLRRVADVRDSIYGAWEDSELSTVFVSTFADIVIARRSEAVHLKQAELRNLNRASHRKNVIQTAKRLRTEYPELYALEEPWLEEVRNAKKRVKDSTRNVRQAGLTLFAIFMIIRVVVGLIKALFE